MRSISRITPMVAARGKLWTVFRHSTQSKLLSGYGSSPPLPRWKPADRLGLRMHERVMRDVEAERFETRTDEYQILDQESLGAADVENAHAGL